MTITRFAFPTEIHFGVGARLLLREHLLSRGLKRPLIVTDRALARLPVLTAFRIDLDGLEDAVFDGIWGNPTAAQVMDGAAAYRAHEADCVIGFGGGAALDVAKVVGLAATHEGDIIEYVWDHPQVRPIVHELPYFVALPTTAGTGSEVGRSAVVSENDSHVKRSVFSPKILARAVFADPELTLGLPSAITAATGMDALTHNIESYLSPAWHPLCDGIALEGLRLGARALERAVKDGDDLAARSDMLMSSMMGAIAFQKDLGGVHACAHALGAVAGLHHGLANALMIDTVLAWNHEAVPRKFDELAHAAGLGLDGTGVVPWLRARKARIGIEDGLRGHGVRDDMLPRMAALAAADFTNQTNPRPAGEADYARLLAAAM
ncbi:MAG: iron-containing alcohol dehydrogenase [Aquabacterium sp.]